MSIYLMTIVVDFENLISEVHNMIYDSFNYILYFNWKSWQHAPKNTKLSSNSFGVIDRYLELVR